MPKTITPKALGWDKQYRIVPSKYPPINFFEDLADPDEMEELFYVESLTNDRLIEQAGNIRHVEPEDRVSGPGSSPVMAAFTHIGKASRFTDGSFGIYYAADSLEAAIAETRFHREIFLRDNKVPPGDIDMRVYIGCIQANLHDIRGRKYDDLHAPDDYGPSQTFGKAMRALKDDDKSVKHVVSGLVYRSVRHPGSFCLAALKPTAVTKPKQGSHLGYRWDGSSVTSVFRKTFLAK